MSLTLDSFAAQHPTVTLAEHIPHAAETHDFTQAIIVNRDQLTAAYIKARFAARRLSSVENLSELDFEAIDDLCRSLYQATTALAEMLDTKGAAAS